MARSTALLNLAHKDYSYAASLQRLIAQSIERNEIPRELFRVCRANRVNYSKVVDGIAAAIAAN